MRALQAKVFGPERGPVVEICAGFSSGTRPKYAQADATPNSWGEAMGESNYHIERKPMSAEAVQNEN